ncbi:hypothetical protein [Hyphococcus sp.]|uniref:hypothetical protein n=1 Tax=Hyphococcus sp. TaxID=2038636 RepID=UPI0035C777D0
MKSTGVGGGRPATSLRRRPTEKSLATFGEIFHDKKRRAFLFLWLTVLQSGNSTNEISKRHFCGLTAPFAVQHGIRQPFTSFFKGLILVVRFCCVAAVIFALA